jgi:coronin-7
LKGTILRREQHVKNIPGLCKIIPGECDFFKVNRKYGAIPIGRTGNQLAVLKLDGRRVEAGQVPSLLLGNSTIGDFAFDPYNDNRIAIGCSDALIKVWLVPEDGLKVNLSEPTFELQGHNNRVTIVEWHPLATDVLTTASVDLSIIIWDVAKREQKITVNLNLPILSFAWHPEGRLLSVLSKDKTTKLSVFDPRKSCNKSIQEGAGPQGTRGGRVIWVNNGSQIAVIGFSRVSERQVILYDASDISKELATESIDVNPAIMIPYFDEGSSTLFLSAKGLGTVYTFELSATSEGAPYIHQLSHFACPSTHQSVAFLPKISCNVQNVEFARAFRLTENSIEPVVFTVPRVRTEYFQDDLFPKQRITWEPVLTGAQWLSGKDAQPVLMDLRPAGMDNLSDAPVMPQTPKKVHVVAMENPVKFKSNVPLKSSLEFLNFGRRQQENLLCNMSAKIDVNGALEQKKFEGVDDQEWDDSE